MDASGIGNELRRLAAPGGPPAASPAKAAGAAGADPARERQLREAAKQFESLFVSILLESMRSTVPESGLLEQGTDLKIYRQMHDQALAEAIGGRGGLGIADMLVQKLGAGVPAADRPAAASRRAPATAPAPAFAPGAMEPVAAGAAQPRAQEASMPAPSPPATSRGEGPLGPPAPLPVEIVARGEAPPAAAALPAAPPARALAGYRLQAELGEQAARLARLRTLAEREGGAAADSLRRWEADIARAADETGVDPALLLAVMVRESGGDPDARSPQGALGLMQLMPGTAREVGVEKPHHPAQNVLGGARYLARMLRGHGRRLDLALAAYNAGPGAVAAAGGRVPPFRETKRYVDGVLDLYRRLGGSGSEPPAADAGGPRAATAAAGSGS